ncbi:hypothetical protein B0H17DRAFT_962920, partial [Mycena rosella]
FYRLVNTDIERYAYTTSKIETSYAFAHGYEFDGVAARVFKAMESSTVPLYHLFNEETQDSFYTRYKRERDEAPEPYVDKGIAAYVFPRRICGSKPLFRLFKPATGAHFYTADEKESERAVENDGYADPIIVGFVHEQ